MKDIAIIGKGYVGNAVYKFLSNHYNIYIYDPGLKEQSQPKAKINECEGAIVSVPTPIGEKGECDLKYIKETFEWLKVPHIMIKSTVDPNTTYGLNVAHDNKIIFSPEFIGEGHYEVPFWKGFPHPTDMKKHDFFIFGGVREETSWWINIWKKVTGPSARYLQTDSTTAELVKYVNNTYGATKVTFFNEIAEISKRLGVDYNELRELLLSDGRISRSHTLVFEDDPGFSGKCYPKDLSALIQASRKLGYRPEFLEEVRNSNERIKSNNIRTDK